MNLANIERWLCIGAGALLLASALDATIRRRRPAGIGLALTGSALIRRGASGYCPAYAALGIDTRPQAERV